jgi:3-phenylpropionate/cinnamic acid dioxygenase small subunit
MPEPRTSHMIANVEVLASGRRGGRALQLPHAEHRYKITDQFFGTAFVTLVERGRCVIRMQEDRAEERLHPPGHRRLSRLTGGRRTDK